MAITVVVKKKLMRMITNTGKIKEIEVFVPLRRPMSSDLQTPLCHGASQARHAGRDLLQRNVHPPHARSALPGRPPGCRQQELQSNQSFPRLPRHLAAPDARGSTHGRLPRGAAGSLEVSSQGGVFVVGHAEGAGVVGVEDDVQAGGGDEEGEVGVGEGGEEVQFGVWGVEERVGGKGGEVGWGEGGNGEVSGGEEGGDGLGEGEEGFEDGLKGRVVREEGMDVGRPCREERLGIRVGQTAGNVGLGYESRLADGAEGSQGAGEGEMNVALSEAALDAFFHALDHVDSGCEPEDDDGRVA